MVPVVASIGERRLGPTPTPAQKEHAETPYWERQLNQTGREIEAREKEKTAVLACTIREKENLRNATYRVRGQTYEGQVRWFCPHRGWGIIYEPDLEAEVFFSRRDVYHHLPLGHPDRDLKAGELVSYTRHCGKRGWFALDVRRRASRSVPRRPQSPHPPYSPNVELEEEYEEGDLKSCSSDHAQFTFLKPGCIHPSSDPLMEIMLSHPQGSDDMERSPTSWGTSTSQGPNLHTKNAVFIGKERAHHVLRKRANNFLEEMLPGNLERECYEETCSREEAREIFKSQEKTTEFWYHYEDLSPCKENPCQNGGICQQYHYTYTCLCPPRYAGKHCENARVECWYNNGGCWQYCTDTPRSLTVTCSCAQGYSLEEDGKKCAKSARFPCGLTTSSPRSLLDPRGRSNSDFSEAENLLSNSTGAITPPNSVNDSIKLQKINETDRPVENDTSHNVTGIHSKNVTTGGEDGNGTTWYEDFIGTILNGEDMSEFGRIVGGMRCELGHCPWQVMIRNSRGTDFCSGSLISQRWVVSAAHCFEGIDPHHVTIGDYDKYLRDQDEQKIAVLKVFPHPYYLGEYYDHDIALLYLRSPAILSDYTRPICLPSPGLGRLLTQEGEIGQVSGWGSTHYKGRASRFLLKVRLPIVSQDTCMASTDMVLTGNMFCAGYNIEARDSCKGDSGGPFAVLYRNTWYLVGVVSWGEGCAQEGKYGVYTRVSNYISWIKDTIIESEGTDEEVVNTL
ncbi:coagulation factor X-like [Anomaloglossus baeobatrachus]|uniref:coagulation factor X-like n=1 Tax=Anomaloglossus baeobatrachus TaxID=238106 RepID=UPI003F50AE21